VRTAADSTYIPSRPLRAGDAEAILELRRTEEGQLAVLAYSSLALLVAGCGEEQPWVAVPRDRVTELCRLTGADAVLWDVGLEPAQRHDTGLGTSRWEPL
jgi:hypothetical protein